MKTFFRLLAFLRPYRRAQIASWLLASLAMVATVAIPYLTGRAVETIQHGVHDGHAHELARQAHERHVLLILALVIVAAVLGRWALMYARRMIAGRVSLAIEVDLRELLYGHLQRLELGFFDHQQTGQLMSRATVDLQAVRFFLGYGLVFVLQSILTIALAGVVMIAIQPALGLIVLVPVPFVVAISYRYGNRARPAIQEVQQRIAELTADAEENISGVRVVKSFAREPTQLEHFRATVGRVFAQAMVATRLEATYNPIIAFLPQLGLAAVLLVGGAEVVHAHLTLGQFSEFYLYVNMLISPMRTLGVTLNLSQRATASGARIFQLLDRQPQLTEAPDAQPLPAGNGHVSFRDVTLRYEHPHDELGSSQSTLSAQRTHTRVAAGAPHPARRAVLEHVSLDVPAGRTVALVGSTGSGKTSLLALISRLYDPVSGSVSLDGVDVRDLQLRPLRAAVAVVSDDPFLFSASVAENIAYARPDATRAEIEAAAERAQAQEFIARLPEGYETLIGERGLTLSGGQRQRLAIARALLANPRVLILDDATSSVDASTEQRIKHALAQAMGNRTTFIVAHRQSTIALADEIVVLEHGRVVAQGPHEQLLERSALYREIVQRTSAEELAQVRL